MMIHNPELVILVFVYVLIFLIIFCIKEIRRLKKTIRLLLKTVYEHNNVLAYIVKNKTENERN